VRRARQSQPHGPAYSPGEFDRLILTARFFPAALTTCRVAAVATAAANFQSNHSNLKSVLAGYFRLQALEQRAGELLDAPTLETRQMNMIHIRLHFVEVLLTVQVHQVEFINQPKFFQKFQSPVHGRPIDLTVTFSRKRQQGSRVQVAFRFLNRFQQDLSLSGDAYAPPCQFLEE
jgi:hypothetical protein